MDPTTDDQTSTSLSAPRRVALILTTLMVAVLVIGTIGPPLFGDGTLLAADQSTLGGPWSSYHSAGELGVGVHGPVTDTIDAVYPTRVAVAQAARDGNVFGWNPYVSGGVPAAAETSNGSLSPFMVAYIALPSWAAPAAIKFLQMAVAIGFTFLFARRIGLSRVPSLFAGASFAGSGFLVMWTNWQQPEVAALIAVLFWATERFLQSPSVARALPISIALGAMLLAGFPAVTGFAVYGLVVYVAMRLWRGSDESGRRRVVTAAGVGAGLLAGVMLVAAVIVPFGLRLGYLDTSSRAQDGSSSQGLATMITTLAPKALGLSTDDVGFMGPRNQVEAISFVGVTTALLVLVALCLPRPRRTPGGARAGLAVILAGYCLLAFGGGPPLELVQHLPVFTDNFVGRASSIIGFTAAVVGAIGLQAVVDGAPLAGRAPRGRSGVVVAAAVLLGAAVIWAAYDTMRDVDEVDVLVRNLSFAALVAVGTISLVGVARRRPGLASLAAAGVVALLVIESLALAVPLVPNEDEELLFHGTTGTAFLTDNVGHDRVAPEELNLFYSATTLFGLRSATGHAFTAPTWKEALTRADPLAFASSPTASRLRAVPEVVTSPVLDRLGVRWFAATPGGETIGRRVPGGLANASCERPVLLGERTTVTIPAEDGLRGVRVRVCATVDLPPTATIETAAEADGEIVGARRHLPSTVPATDMNMSIPADDLGGGGPITVSLGMGFSDGRALALATDPSGAVAVDLVRPDDDGLRMAFAGDLDIYERTRALPRIRWAGSALVVEEFSARLRLLGSGALSEGTTVLSEPAVRTSGADGSVTIVEDSPTAIVVDAVAGGDGLVVVADALQVDWQATVDGEPVDLVDADHAGVGVPVGEGSHRIELRYAPRGQRAGTIVSIVTALGLIAAVVGARLARSRSRSRQ